ncbi:MULTISPECIES: DUF4159 domain-containing protein [unclassified Beijerinckia]|uniref:DUF4159 domain-containing protein n=1 Tax=unclassified Beijerinckia TaxID=2638183 RepID=UPI00089AC073|nr:MULTISPECIES: DUF4159 domain-containing protein [unclassified Beijerinckia]MDH7794201.1 hypothetical protein [Beijerinckia sp. GAS462]SEB55617.1 N-terminal double-transmembrane domain-containing protein [Beijerinckia sp. 28-YEA-48]
MLGLPLAFTAPLVLASLALLPLLWYLLRITPPRPRPIAFPPLKLILDLQPKDDTPARTPWWLMLMRLLLAAAIIFAMAGPIWNPRPTTETGKGPLLVIVDDGWPAAVQWNLRVSAASEAIASATRQGRASAVAAVSEGVRDIAISDPAKATERLRAMKPVPYMPERAAALTAIRKFIAANPQSDIFWIADGVATGNARGFAEGLIDAAGDSASVRVLTATQTPLALGGAQNAAGALDVRVLRAGPAGAPQGQLRAYDLKGLPVGEAGFAFAGGSNETSARFELPIELRNEIARIEIDQEHSAGAVTLLDSRAKRRRVAIVTGVTADVAQPLLSPSYYVMRALGPFADVREPRAGTRDPVSAALDDQPSVLVLADVGVVGGAVQERLRQYIEDGGVLLRFAGSRLAASTDEFVPVRLRRGGRVLGGSLSWDTPRRLAPFDRESPFYGLPVSEEVTVRRQVLAEPEAGLPGKTWAALEDGTPMVTAIRRGKGMVVLVHVTADTTWSNLPLSGLFVDMLRRIVAMSGESAAGTESGTASGEGQVNRAETAAPTRTLDGFGVLGNPPITAKPIALDHDGIGSADHPPGFYGPIMALIAVNTLSPKDKLEAANFSGLRLETQALRPADPVDLRPWLIALAFALYLADALASIWLGGGLAALRRGGKKVGGAAVASCLLLLALAAMQMVQSVPASAQAQFSPSPFPRPDLRFPSQRMQMPATLGDIHPALVTRLAYAVTGDARVDEASRAGLMALSRALAARTALTPGDPMGVNPAKDELTFFPLIYWPVVAAAPQPSPEAVARISNFMKQGGTIVFDTRDAMTSRPGEAPTPETQWLRTLLAGVDVPELEVVPRDHVVTKTFYLLDNFIGRTTVGQTWIEALPPPTEDPAQRPARAGDSVSPIIITSNDLAAAWAMDNSGQPLYPLIPGTNRQREMAIRGGVNLVMYTLTGNYKSDQVHVRDLLERLGH